MKKVYLLAFAFALTASVAFAQSAPYFSVNLTVGSTPKAEVIKLQNFLISQGFLGTTYNTGSFGTLTQKAVAAFQTANNISPASGYFGTLTRAIANQKVSGSSPTPTVTPAAPAQKSEIRVESVTDETSSAAVILSKAKTVKWKTTNYPKGAGVNINLLRKVSDTPLSYSLVRVISTDSADDGVETWVPQTGENTNDLYIEITCSSSFKFSGGCQFSTGPVKIN